MHVDTASDIPAIPQLVRNPNDVVTERQLELIALFAGGYDYHSIARMKFLSYNSVRRILAEARDRVGARNLTHLCMLCAEAGVIAKNGHGWIPVLVEGVVGE